MNKILIIIAREYITRVRKRSFIVMSILGPILIAGVYTVPLMLVFLQTGHTKVKVLDHSFLTDSSLVLKGDETVSYEYVSGRLNEELGALLSSDADALLYIPAFDLDDPKGFEIFSDETVPITVVRSIESQIEDFVYEKRLAALAISRETIRGLSARISIKTENISAVSESGEAQTKETNIAAAMVVGGMASAAIYILVILYGSMVMRGIVEEKTNRIVEVIISSVKPFQLMMGKIIGIAGVGLTQILIWIILGAILVVGASVLFGAQMGGALSPEAMQAAQSGEAQEAVMQVQKALTELNLTVLLFSFVFYFIFGYLMYASLFGAVGALVDQEADSQQFVFPVILPLLISFMAIGQVTQEPNGVIAFWLSMFPLTSPVVMMMRVPFIGWGWELFLSMALLVGGFVAVIWLSAKIYRVGILMYGKKPTVKEIFKWIRYSH